MFDLIKKNIASDNGKAQTTDQDALTAHLALTVPLLEAHEDNFTHKLAPLLRLSHHQLIDAKLRARKQLS